MLVARAKKDDNDVAIFKVRGWTAHRTRFSFN